VTYEHLFRPGQLGTLSVRNRVVMAPIDSVLRTEDGASTPAHAAYLAARAAGGVGLIICDNLIVEWPRGSVGSKSLRLDQDRFIASLNEMVEEVHYWGAAIVAQINHAGRQTTLGGSQGIGLVSPSPIAWPDSGTIPRELSKSDIRAMVDLFVAAARRARMARFDGVQIHAAHGYLLASFLSPALNQRTDEYGGSTANRARIVIQIIDRIRSELPASYPLLVRMNSRDGLPGGIEPGEAAEIASLLADAGVDAIDVSAGVYESPALTFPPMMYPDGVLMDGVRTVRNAVTVPVIGVGKLSTPDVCDRYIADGYADFVALGRALLADAEWPEKAATGRASEIRPCIACNVGCIHRIDQDLSMRCNVNPDLGREAAVPRRPAERALTLGVVGAGPAGLEFAVRATDLGHRVQLYERDSEVGGQLTFARVPPFKASLGQLVDYYAREVARRDIELILDREVTRATLDELDVDAVVFATGGTPATPLRFADDTPIPTYKDVLQGSHQPADRVVVIGGGPNGCELAIYLARNGHSVAIVELADGFAITEDPSIRQWVTEQFATLSITTHARTRIVSVDHTAIYGETTRADVTIPCESVILAAGVLPERELIEECGLSPRRMHAVGDCVAVGTILEATERAARLAERITLTVPPLTDTSQRKEAKYVV
jgi:2,4-dienoyl-CoA reductase-like NADH-dependent reductase (Old Yellow Enzyme family)/NADPH-dependent 2,4-dienoyl-CoA reductase/sulfur reductase-like enzyme